MPEPKPPSDEPRPTPAPPTRIIATEQLFEGGQREITIEHAGERYRLRITRRNKLILQK